jgi:glycosyltransferase involved in cell wall biosynthesis
MYKGKTVSVVFGTYREKGSIKRVIEEFFATGFVDEVIVVNNNAESGTDEQVKKTKAKLIYEPKQGYGAAYQTGITQSTGDWVILCEPDGSYTGSDVEKFLVYTKDGFDVVFGSRTGHISLLAGADMTVWRKFANVIEAKTIEILFNTQSLTDVGCTYKLFSKSAIKKLSRQWKTTNALFSTELVLLTVTHKLKFIEIPITFKKRVGQSSLTGQGYKLVKWGIFIQLYILSFWIKSFFKK